MTSVLLFCWIYPQHLTLLTQIFSWKGCMSTLVWVALHYLGQNHTSAIDLSVFLSAIVCLSQFHSTLACRRDRCWGRSGSPFIHIPLEILSGGTTCLFIFTPTTLRFTLLLNHTTLVKIFCASNHALRISGCGCVITFWNSMIAKPNFLSLAQNTKKPKLTLITLLLVTHTSHHLMKHVIWVSSSILICLTNCKYHQL